MTSSIEKQKRKRHKKVLEHQKYQFNKTGTQFMRIPIASRVSCWTLKNINSKCSMSTVGGGNVYVFHLLSMKLDSSGVPRFLVYFPLPISHTQARLSYTNRNFARRRLCQRSFSNFPLNSNFSNRSAAKRENFPRDDCVVVCYGISSCVELNKVGRMPVNILGPCTTCDKFKKKKINIPLSAAIVILAFGNVQLGTIQRRACSIYLVK